MFLPFALGYYMSYVYRVIGAIVADRLQADIGLAAGDLGLLTAAYFVAFAAAQLPVGLVLDRYGPRRVNATLLLVAAVGSVVFALGDSLLQLWVGRALIGLGYAAGLMAGLKAITQWFPKRRWPLVNGLYLSLGGLGAMSATAPVEALLGVTTWRTMFLVLAGLTLAVAALILLVVPERRASGAPPDMRTQLSGILAIYRERFFWRLAPVAFTCMATSFAIQTLWAGPWLRDVAGLDRGEVATVLFAMTAAMTVGFVLWGALAERLERRGVRITWTFGGGVLVYLGALGIIATGTTTAALWPWLVFGLTGNIAALSFALLARHVPPAYTGRANTAVNLLIFAGAFLAQSAMGGILDLWPSSAGRYPPEAYRAAFGVFWVLCAGTWLWYLAAARRAPLGRSEIGNSSE